MPNLLSALQTHFHYKHFRPGQEDALRHILQQQDALVVMPTGAGKSLIYQLAALQLEGVALVFSPLIALMKDQVDGMNKRGIPATFINSSLELGEMNTRTRELVQGKYKLVLIAPERLRSSNFRAALKSIPVSMLVLDEAHCLSQWGHDFRPDYLNIAQLRQELQPKITLALTATATPRTQASILELLAMPNAQPFINGFNRPNIFFEVLPTPSPRHKLQRIKDYLQARSEEGNTGGIIYVGTRKDAEEVAAFVREQCGVNAQHYHGAVNPSERAKTQDLFIAGDLPVVVATNAFGMGIDRPDVRWVLHHTLPSSLEAYYQEAGRAGRDGLPARATLLQSAQDVTLQEFFINNDAPTPDELRRVHSALVSADGTPTDEDIAQRLKLGETKVRVATQLLAGSATGSTNLSDAAIRNLLHETEIRREHKRALLRIVLQFSQTDDCRRRLMLDYFGDSGAAEANTQCCDNCEERARAQMPSQQRPAQTRTERGALIVLDTVALMTQRGFGVGKGKLSQILKGSQTEEIVRFQDNRNFGKFHELAIKEIESLVTQLLSAGYLKQAGNERPVLQVSLKGETTLKARAAVDVTIASVELNKVVRPRTAENTIELTRKLLSEGKGVSEIAVERALTEGTIYSHCAQLIAEQTIHVDAVIDTARQMTIRAAIKQVGNADALSPIKAILPEFVNYNEIKCVVEAWRLEQGIARPKAQAATQTPKPTQPDATPSELFERLRRWRADRAKAENVPPYLIAHDSQLHAIAEQMPTTLMALESVRGWGAKKIEKYGADVLRVVGERVG